MNGRRLVASRTVAILAAVLAVAATVAVYARLELLDAGRFSRRATDALRDRDVRDLVAQEVTDEVVLKADPDLLAARPLLQTVTASVIGSGPFLTVYRSGVRRLHASLIAGRRSRLQLDLRDAGIVVQAALRRFQPKLAHEVQARDVTLQEGNGIVDAVAAGARTLRVLSWALVVAALVAIAGALALAPVRREALRLLGVATAAAALVALVALTVARAVAVTAIGDDDLSRHAAGAVWEALLGDLGTTLVVLAAVGAVTAAVAATHGDLPDAGPWLARAWRRVAATPARDGARAARALALVVAGVLALLDPAAAARTAAAAAGVLLVYVGADELLEVLHRRLGPAPVEPAATRNRRRLAHLRRGVPVAVVLLLAAGGVAAVARSGGVDPPAAQRTDRCNGSLALCDRRLDEVVLPATHNAMSAADEPGWFSAEQEGSIAEQLRDGVRGLLIDAHYGDRVPGGVRTDLGPRSERAGDADRALYLQTLGPQGLAAIQRLRDRAISGTGEPGVFLCHRFCELGATEMVAALRSIRDFLVLNPGEVLVIVVEDYVVPADVVAAFRASGLDRLVYRGPPAGPFPTLRTMIDTDQRVVVYAEHQAGAAPWYSKGYAGALQETPYTFKTTAALTAPAALPASCVPNRGTAGAPLLLLNHWVNTDPAPRVSQARVVNARDALVARARVCERVRHRLPNLVAVNFYRSGDLMGAVRALNARR